MHYSQAMQETGQGRKERPSLQPEFEELLCSRGATPSTARRALEGLGNPLDS